MNIQDGNDENESKSSDELRAEIDQTRERVSEDVEALGQKLSPENLKAEAKQAVSRTLEQGGEAVREKWEHGTERLRETVRRGAERVRETADHAETSVLGFVRDNPVPLLLIGAGVGLLLWGGRGRSAGSHGPDLALVGRGGVYEGFTDEQDSSGASGRIHQLRERAQSGLTNARHTASDAARRARSEVDQLEQRAKEQARRAKDAAERSFNEQPLVLGAVALGAGVAVGLSIPATDSENQLVGRYRDRLFGSVKQRAKELEGKAESALTNAAESLTGQGGAQRSAAE